MVGSPLVPVALLFFIIFDSSNTAADILNVQNNFKSQFGLEPNAPISDSHLVSEINTLFRKDFLEIPSYAKNLFSRIRQDEILKEELLAEVSAQCRSQTSAWIDALSSLNTTRLLGKDLWALQMMDSWSKLPEGILSGHTSSLGDFEECLRVRGEVETSDGQIENFKGKYCAVTLVPTFFFSNNMSRLEAESDTRTLQQASALGSFPTSLFGIYLLIPKMGTCYPSSCSDADGGQLLQNALNIIPEVGQQLVQSVTYCTTDDSRELKTGDIAMACILAVILALCLSGTIIDLTLGPKSSSRNGYGVQALLAFSVYTNTMKWLNTKGGGGENFGSMHGIRFMSTCWVILAHQWGQAFSNTWNMLEVGEIHKSNWTLFSIFNATVSVDTFFTMSGLLFAYNMLKVLQKSNGKINIPLMYVHRYLRLTPTYALLVGLVATFYVYLGNGPLWNTILISSASCRNNWWHNLLYINNLIKYSTQDAEHQMCHGETWYLANDMQFFLISPLLIYPLFRWEKLGMALLSLVSIASIATPWIVHATYEPTLLPTVLPTRDMGKTMEISYMKPWMRFGPYAVGLWAGFLLYKTANRKVKLSKLAVLAGWALSTATALAIVYGIIPWFDPAQEIPEGLGAFYAGTHRFAWGIVISWIIFACSRGYGGPINRLLSWNAFIPLGRLSFCAFLISYNIQILYTGRQLQVVTYDTYTTTLLYFSHLVTTLIVSFICCICMESPFIALEKLLFNGPTSPKVTPPPPKVVEDLHGVPIGKQEV